MPAPARRRVPRELERGSMPTVLIVDDDKFTRTVLHTIFSQEPAFSAFAVEAITADDGEDGLMAFREHQPDIVVTDLLMPRMDGFSLCRAIRAEPRGGEVHLIAMSSVYRDAAVARRVQAEFGAEFFAKPYQLRDMTQYIATLLEGGLRQRDDEPSGARVAPSAIVAYVGNLAERPLPEVLFDFLEAQATGRLTLRRGRVTKTIELIVGHPLSVSSSARDESLGHFLELIGAITEDDHKRAVQWAVEHKEKVSDALISLSVITPEQMVTYLTMHTCHKLVQSLRWPDGMWRFQPHDWPADGPRGNPIDMVPLVLQGLRHTASFDALPERIAAVEGRPLMLTARGRRLLPAVRQCLSSKLADEWADRVTVPALAGAGIERNELYTTLEALFYCAAVVPCDEQDGVVEEWAEDADTAWDSGDFSVEELSEHSQIQRVGRNFDESARELYAMLFEDTSVVAPLPVGELPIELPEDGLGTKPVDSGIIDVADMQRGRGADNESNYARRLVLKEYLRIQGLDYYAILEMERDARTRDLRSAVEERRAKFALDWFSRYDLGRDYAKLEEIHAAYDRVVQVLCDPGKRSAYDRSLSGASASEPSLDAEIAFHAGQDLVQHGSYEGAIEKLRTALEAAPDEAHYHAALGWAYYLKGNRTPRAADEARPYLNQALAINPDHVLSHEYKGIISAELGNDEEEPVLHLERALDIEPGRTEALRVLEEIWKRRGELRPLERQYRRSIYRMAGSDPRLECQLWLKLADLYRTELHEPRNARIAFESAARLAPDDESIQAALADIDRGAPDRFAKHGELLRRQWSRDPMNPAPGHQLMHEALAANRPDAAFMAASALVARGCADRKAEAFYQRYRPRFVIRAHRQLDLDLWEYLRHPHDSNDLAALFSLIGPAVEHSFPLDLDDLEAMAVEEMELPEPFVRVRAYAAHMLGGGIPRVFVRPDFGHQIHVGAVTPPFLLAGDDVLTSPERAELSFRLGRAMTYLLPGRTIAASRPARLLRAVVLALFRRINPDVVLDDPHGQVAQVQANLSLLSPDVLEEAEQIVARITTANQSLNLSRWVRALGRTADRMGLLLCGDLPAAVRFSRDSGNSESTDDLIDFAISDAFLTLRAQVGLSIDV